MLRFQSIRGPLRESFFWILGVGLLAVGWGWGQGLSTQSANKPPGEAGLTLFVEQVRPLLQSYCIKCHGGTLKQSGLDLTTRDSLLRGGDSGPAIVPGDAKASLLYKLVTHEKEPGMPFGAEKLPAPVIARIADWINAGAPYDLPPTEGILQQQSQSDHWAFKRPKPPPLPAVRNRDWVRNPIDCFILAKLEKEGIEPSQEADRATLIRRLSLDLLGLPPSVAEVDDYVNDSRHEAYERLVDRLLVSPHYGERWARHWLDVARYADSNGYTNDNPRSMWRYRDWVIRAFNEDLSFDKFTIYQIAGDMLPNATVEQKIATGFHRNTLINEEGGADKEQFRIESVADRVNTTGAVFLGLTVGCARCHSHKYDPITQREYYQLFAFFNKSDEPNLEVPAPEQREKLDQIRKRIAELENQAKAHDATIGSSPAVWESEMARSASSWTVLDPTSFLSAGGATGTKLKDLSLLLGGINPDQDVYTVVAKTTLKDVTGFRVEVLTDPSLPKTGPGRSENGNFVLSEFRVEIVDPLVGSTDAKPVALQRALAEYSQKDWSISHAIDGHPKTGWAVATGSENSNVSRVAVFETREKIALPPGSTLKFILEQRHSKPNYTIGRLRFSVTTANTPLSIVPLPVAQALAIPREKRDEKERMGDDRENKLLAAAYRESDQVRKEIYAKIDELKKSEPRDVTAMVMQERTIPRETHILIRGDFLRPGDRVLPGVPAVLPPLPEGEKANRLDLARWLVSPNNPLTSRAQVNRVWQQYFGRGVVETENDFGTRGALPTHPELFDWLATEFVAKGWSMKALHRLIVCSATYRQSSYGRPDLLSKDPRNQLLARQSRLRVEAEIIRDVALTVSGLLSRKIGGPSVFPYQPEGVMSLTQVKRSWEMSEVPDRYRRGMYTHFWRASPHPFLTLFDAPDAVTTCTRRTRSNTPLQTLMLLNDELFLECARGLAVRVLEEAPANDTERIRYAFRLCLSRKPKSAELHRLSRLLELEKKDFSTAPIEDAQQLIGPGQGRGANIRQLAAWTALCRVLLNLDECITRE